MKVSSSFLHGNWEASDLIVSLGTATLLGATIFASSFETILHLIGILFAFFLGASLSGFLLNSSSLKLGRHYDTALVIESLLILVAFFLLSEGSYYGHFAASAA